MFRCGAAEMGFSSAPKSQLECPGMRPRKGIFSGAEEPLGDIWRGAAEMGFLRRRGVNWSYPVWGRGKGFFAAPKSQLEISGVGPRTWVFRGAEESIGDIRRGAAELGSSSAPKSQLECSGVGPRKGGFAAPKSQLEISGVGPRKWVCCGAEESVGDIRRRRA